MSQVFNQINVTPKYYDYDYDGLNLASQKGWKLGVFGWKLEGSNSSFHCYFDRY